MFGNRSDAARFKALSVPLTNGFVKRSWDVVSQVRTDRAQVSA